MIKKGSEKKEIQLKIGIYLFAFLMIIFSFTYLIGEKIGFFGMAVINEDIISVGSRNDLPSEVFLPESTPTMIIEDDNANMLPKQPIEASPPAEQVNPDEEVPLVISQDAALDINNMKGTGQNEILVKFRDTNSKSAANLVDPIRLNYNSLSDVKDSGFIFNPLAKDDVGLDRWVLISFDNNVNLEEEVKKYLNDPNVEYAEINQQVLTESESSVSLKSTIPSDPSFPRQWYLDNTGQYGLSDADIDAPEAWDISRGSSSVVIAVIDSGIDYTHPDLGGCMGASCKVINGYDFYNNDNDPIDDNGHGTEVSGIISAISNNNNYYYASKIRLDVTQIPLVQVNDQNMWIHEIRAYNTRTGTSNLALNKPVNASTFYGTHIPSHAIDGNPYTYWQVKGTNTAWMEIDLLGLFEIDKITFNFTGNYGPINYTVKIYNSSNQWQLINNITNNYLSYREIALYNNIIDGVAGVCWNCKLMPMKVSNAANSLTSSSAIASAIINSAYNGASILQLGFIKNNYSQLEQDAINYASQYSIIIAPAGDYNSNIKKYPAGYDKVISVGSIDSYNKRFSSNYASNKDKWIELSSYGEYIKTLTLNNQSTIDQGTSMASSIVAGVMALVKSYHPDWSNNQIIGQVLSTTEKIDYDDLTAYPDNVSILGSGRVNAYNALSVTPQNNLVFKGYDILDPFGNNDSYLNPGETVAIRIKLRSNYGDFSNVNVVLSSANPFITILSSNCNYGSINLMQTKTCDFSLRLANDASLYKTFINFSLSVNANGYSTNIPVRIDIQNNFKPGWPVSAPTDESFQKTIVGDINNDGYQEIIVGTGNKIYAYDKTGNLINGWPVTLPIGFSYYATIALADLNKDAKREIVVATNNYDLNQVKIFAYKNDATLLAGWPVTINGTSYVSGLAIADVNNDNNFEIFANTMTYNYAPISKIYSFKQDGTPFLPFGIKEIQEAYVSPLALGDINNDNNLEIFTLGGDSNLYAWTYDGQNLPGYPVSGVSISSFFGPAESVILSDVNNDNQLEVIVNGGKNVLLNGNGSILWSKPSSFWDYWVSTTAVGDFNNDGFQEIAFTSLGSTGMSQGLKLKVYDKNGNLINSCWDSFYIESNANYYIYSADVDDDQKAEIILTGSDNNNPSYFYQSKVLAYNEDCSLVQGYPLLDGINQYSTIADIDNDGRLELVTSTNDYLSVFNLNTPPNKVKNKWTMLRHDVLNTGNSKFCDCSSGYSCRPNGMCIKNVKPTDRFPAVDPGFDNRG